MMAAGLLTATSAMAIGSQDNNDALIQDATTSNETATKAAQPKRVTATTMKNGASEATVRCLPPSKITD